MSTIDAERLDKKILNREPDCCAPLGELKRSSDKTIFYQLPLPSDGLPVPYPESFTDCPFSTDSSQSMEFVEMPFSLSNSSRNQIGQEASHWSEIVRYLTDTPILTTKELISAIKACNSTYKKRNFNVLRQLMENNLTDEDKDYFFEETLPKIIELVIQLPKLIRQPIPILKQKVNHSLYFSQQQIASLIANAFFCTFKDKKRTSSSKLLDINLIRLYVEQERFNVHHKILKLRCILNYFRRVTRNLPKGTVSFERRFLQPDEIPKWNKSNKNLTKIVVKSDKLIEKKGKGLLQVNSTYQLIGADFMNSDTRSQMIRSFLAYPELLMLRLFTELMLNNESLLIVGVEKFNRRSLRKGYYSNCVDKTQTDEWGRRYIKLLALDAKYFAWDKISNQYKKSYIDRELNKAYSGFIDRSESDPKHRCAIATGKWGCFNKRGDPQLKSLIQLLAASQAERDLMFCSLKDIKLADELKEMKKILIEKGLNVSQLYKILCQFDESLETEYPEKGLLFPYLTQQLSTFNANN